MVFGPKYHVYYSIWALKPYYLGLWTLRVFKLHCCCSGRVVYGLGSVGFEIQVLSLWVQSSGIRLRLFRALYADGTAPQFGISSFGLEST